MCSEGLSRVICWPCFEPHSYVHLNCIEGRRNGSSSWVDIGKLKTNNLFQQDATFWTRLFDLCYQPASIAHWTKGLLDLCQAHWDYQRGKFVLGKYLQLGYICKKKYLLIWIAYLVFQLMAMPQDPNNSQGPQNIYSNSSINMCYARMVLLLYIR
jgi:hypothetical protein